MSFGWSASDIANVVKLAYRTVQNCRKACGEYDELTREVESLHQVLRRLQTERAKPKSLLNRPAESHWEELGPSIAGSSHIFKALNSILEKYPSVKDGHKGWQQRWQRAKFGNKEVASLADLRMKAMNYATSISFHLNMVGLGSIGRIEEQLVNAGLQDMKQAIVDMAKQMAASTRGEGSILTAYTDDDAAVWKTLRRELVKTGIMPSGLINKNMPLIISFIQELGEKGELDDPKSQSPKPQSLSEVSNDEDDISNGSSHSSINSSPDGSSILFSDSKYRRIIPDQRPPFRRSVRFKSDDESSTSSSDESARSDDTTAAVSSGMWHHGRIKFRKKPRNSAQQKRAGVTKEALAAFDPLPVNARLVAGVSSYDLRGSLSDAWFLPTFWGTCFIVRHVNVSKLLEEFKLCMQNIAGCLSSPSSVDTAPSDEVAKDSEGYRRESDLITALQELAELGQMTMQTLAYPKGEQAKFLVGLPGVPTGLHDAATFCDRYLQRLYDASRIVRRESAQFLAENIKKWLHAFYEDGDWIIARQWEIFGRPRQHDIADGRTHHWIFKSHTSEPLPSIHTDDGVLESLETEDLLHEVENISIVRLAAIVRRYETDFYLQALAYVTSPPLDPVARQKGYQRLNEAIEKNIILELDAIPSSNEDLRVTRKNAVEEIQAMLEALENVSKKPD